MEHAFCSCRLVYRGIKDNNKDISFLHTAIQLNSISIAQSENEILRPQTRKSSKGLVTSLVTKTLLGVMICLPRSRSSTLGISTSRQYRGMGYGSEAINWALDWAFKFSGVHSVSPNCFSSNMCAEKLYERLEFMREGRRRERVWFNKS
ncbi:hypothetical protein AOQ84DRAFT_423820 [Glonium stellatum]|uniref:N-acetyltransferase domain-containing protein n=1 Tax=Glonium stellatum TaxID=574774 RepID=A0A8E2JM72_9PEZI|nr:hypothetical protein AOQ84DRAFT_423820 [Glonium stellatum]